MKNKNTVKDLVKAMEENGENTYFIIGWLSSMIQSNIDWKSDMQGEVDSGLTFCKEESIRKTCNKAKLEELYAWSSNQIPLY